MPDVVKVTLNGTTLIDHSDATVEADKVLQSYVGYEGDGDRFVGTYQGGSVSTTHTATITRTDGQTIPRAQVNGTGTYYRNNGETFTWEDGDYIRFYLGSDDYNWNIYVNDVLVATTQYFNFTPPKCDIEIWFGRDSNNSTVRITYNHLDITENGIYDTSDYNGVTVSVGTTADYLETRNALSGAFYTSNATAIGNYDFAFTFVSGVSMSLCSFIGASAFYSCTKLTEANFQNAGVIEQSAFFRCDSLTTISFPSCTMIGTYCFNSCVRLSNASFPNCSQILNGAFRNCSSLTSVYFPSCKVIYSVAFSSCSALRSVDFPLCSWIYTSVFYGCTSLAFASFPVCSTINNNAFCRCSALEEVYFPLCNVVSDGAFSGCSALRSVDFPLCLSVKYNAFSGCRSLSYVSLPVCGSIESYAFRECYALQSINLPLCTSISASAFYNCTSLATVSLPAIFFIAPYAFAYCSNLLSVYVLGSSVPVVNSTAFLSTPISDYTTTTGGVYGSIFVRASLYDAFISATNWSLFSDRIVSLTDAEIEALG